METTLVGIIFTGFLLAKSFSPAIAAVTPLLLVGVHPLDENYFASAVIKCKDGSKSFTRDRLNDDYCDCLDGTDEPGTAACVAGKFYCGNLGSKPKFLFSSRVNDRICDCCDGSDEYDGTVHCPNTCVMGGHITYATDRKVSFGKSSEDSAVADLDNIHGKEGKSKMIFDDLIHKLKGLKMLVILQVILICCVIVLRLCQRRVRSRRRRYRSVGYVLR